MPAETQGSPATPTAKDSPAESQDQTVPVRQTSATSPTTNAATEQVIPKPQSRAEVATQDTKVQPPRECEQTDRASFVLHLPPGATVFVNGKQMPVSGRNSTFNSPTGLEKCKDFRYVITAQWPTAVYKPGYCYYRIRRNRFGTYSCMIQETHTTTRTLEQKFQTGPKPIEIPIG